MQSELGEDGSFAVTTVNLNGIRAAMKRGFGSWLDTEKPDIVLMQEVRAPSDITADLMGDEWQVVSFPCEVKGRAGVAVAVRRGLEIGSVTEGIPGDDVDPRHTGRWLEVDVDLGFPLRVVSTYLHSGEVGSQKQELKMEHLGRVQTRMGELLSGVDGPSSILVAGDFNIVRSENDIKNWKPNHNKHAGVLDDEIAFVNNWAQAGWVDVVRDLAGDVFGPYSWWSWRGRAFDNDTGWRIDYQFATPELAKRSSSFDVYRASTGDLRFSDHAPVTVRYRY